MMSAADATGRASAQDIVKSLWDDWHEEHLFALKQAVEIYGAYACTLYGCHRQRALHLRRKTAAMGFELTPAIPFQRSAQPNK